MKLHVSIVGYALGGCAAVAISACGSSTPSASTSPKEPSATELQSSVRSAVSAANSVHFDGQLTNHGLPVGVNIGLDRAGDMSGTITQNGANLQVLGVNRKVYVKATPEFLKQVKAPSSACAIMCGRWVELPPQQASQITGQLNLHSLTGAVNSGKQPKLTEAGSTTVNGQPAWVMKAADGSVVDISQSSPHYPLALHAGGGKKGVFMFSQWNSVPHPTAPPASQVINLSGLHP
jgi:hypothetical protein